MSLHKDIGAVQNGFIALVVAILVGVGAAVGLSFGLVSLGSATTQVTSPLVNYNSP